MELPARLLNAPGRTTSGMDTFSPAERGSTPDPRPGME
nr:MAG TPA: hypothetical protein [Caudoviricetes sp.]